MLLDGKIPGERHFLCGDDGKRTTAPFASAPGSLLISGLVHSRLCTRVLCWSSMCKARVYQDLLSRVVTGPEDIFATRIKHLTEEIDREVYTIPFDVVTV